MKKNVVVIMLMFLSVSWPVMAQVAFGVRAGLAYSSMAQKLDERIEANARLGFRVAAVADIPAWNEFSIRPEIAFLQQGGGFYSNPMPFGGLWEEESPRQVKSDYYYYSIQIPVNICYTFNVGDVDMNLFGGPAIDIPLYGRVHTPTYKYDLQIGKDRHDDIRPVDFGINIGLGVELSNFTFAVHTLFGMIDRRSYKEEGEKSVYQNNVTFSLGYFFR